MDFPSRAEKCLGIFLLIIYPILLSRGSWHTPVSIFTNEKACDVDEAVKIGLLRNHPAVLWLKWDLNPNFPSLNVCPLHNIG